MPINDNPNPRAGGGNYAPNAQNPQRDIQGPAANFENLIDEPVNPAPAHAAGVQAAPQPQPRNNMRDDVYTQEEQQDLNKIRISVPDTHTPIVVFFGAPSSGKTLVLLRMIRFWEKKGYKVVPEAVFRPSTDRHYARMCVEIRNKAYDKCAPDPNDDISFMLVKVVDCGGNPVCQVLEAPGEHYYNGTSDLTFPTYITDIRLLPNRKVWVFFVEPDWGTDASDRNRYAAKICQMQTLLSPNDKVVFLFNKADQGRLKALYTSANLPNKRAFFNIIKDQYPGIFDAFSTKGWLASLLFGPYKFKAVCFSSGVFTPTSDSKKEWTPESDWYCQELWNTIK